MSSTGDKASVVRHEAGHVVVAEHFRAPEIKCVLVPSDQWGGKTTVGGLDHIPAATVAVAGMLAENRGDAFPVTGYESDADKAWNAIGCAWPADGLTKPSIDDVREVLREAGQAVAAEHPGDPDWKDLVAVLAFCSAKAGQILAGQQARLQQVAAHLNKEGSWP